MGGNRGASWFTIISASFLLGFILLMAQRRCAANLGGVCLAAAAVYAQYASGSAQCQPDDDHAPRRIVAWRQSNLAPGEV